MVDYSDDMDDDHHHHLSAGAANTLGKKQVMSSSNSGSNSGGTKSIMRSSRKTSEDNSSKSRARFLNTPSSKNGNLIISNVCIIKWLFQPWPKKVRESWQQLESMLTIAAIISRLGGNGSQSSQSWPLIKNHDLLYFQTTHIIADSVRACPILSTATTTLARARRTSPATPSPSPEGASPPGVPRPPQNRPPTCKA